MEEEQSLVEAKIEWSKGKKRKKAACGISKNHFFCPFFIFLSSLHPFLSLQGKKVAYDRCGWPKVRSCTRKRVDETRSWEMELFLHNFSIPWRYYGESRDLLKKELRLLNGGHTDRWRNFIRFCVLCWYLDTKIKIFSF